MRKEKPKYQDLIEMAKDYGVADNALFLSAVKQYELQRSVIDRIRVSLEEDDMTVTKQYVKGRENLCVNPLVQQLPQHTTAANKTLETILSIITKLGRKPEVKTSRFGDLDEQ